jgi:hypothetical protein
MSRGDKEGKNDSADNYQVYQTKNERGTSIHTANTCSMSPTFVD